MLIHQSLESISHAMKQSGVSTESRNWTDKALATQSDEKTDRALCHLEARVLPVKCEKLS
jgi:hypothetical protein